MRNLLCAAVLVLCTTTLLADTVYFKNGRKMVGKVTLKGDQVIVENEAGTFAFSRRQVDRIKKDQKKPGQRVTRSKRIVPKRAWEALPDMPRHRVAFDRIERGHKLVGVDPREAMTVFARVKSVSIGAEGSTVTFGEPAESIFKRRHTEFFTFFKVDSDTTRAKLLFFGAVAGDTLTLSLTNDSSRSVTFKGLFGAHIVVREGVKARETLPASSIYMVRNKTGKARALESYLKHKGMREGDLVRFTGADGVVYTGKLVRGKSGMEVESEARKFVLDWPLAEKLSAISTGEYEGRTMRVQDSKAAYTLVVKPGDDVRAALAAYGEPDEEGNGITGEVGFQGTKAANLYTRHFAKKGIWISSRDKTIYEVEVEKGFDGKIFGIGIGDKIRKLSDLTDIRFYRPEPKERILVSDTLEPLRVTVIFDQKTGVIERITVTDTKRAREWGVKADAMLRKRAEKQNE